MEKVRMLHISTQYINNYYTNKTILNGFVYISMYISALVHCIAGMTMDSLKN